MSIIDKLILCKCVCYKDVQNRYVLEADKLRLEGERLYREANKENFLIAKLAVEENHETKILAEKMYYKDKSPQNQAIANKYFDYVGQSLWLKAIEAGQIHASEYCQMYKDKFLNDLMDVCHSDDCRLMKILKIECSLIREMWLNKFKLEMPKTIYNRTLDEEIERTSNQKDDALNKLRENTDGINRINSESYKTALYYNLVWKTILEVFNSKISKATNEFRTFDWHGNKEKELRQLYNKLIDNHIAPETTEAQFFDIFSNKPIKDLIPLKWIHTNELLAFFLFKCFQNVRWQSIVGNGKFLKNKSDKTLTATDLSKAHHENVHYGEPNGADWIVKTLNEIKESQKK